MKKPIPWGRGLATVLAVVAFCIAIVFAHQWWQTRRQCADAEATILAVLPDAFGTSGTVEAVFAPKYAFTCKEMLVVEHDLPDDRSPDGVMATVKGLDALLEIVAQSGKVALARELKDCVFSPCWAKSGAGSVLPAVFFSPVAAGEYRLRLTVKEPALPLVGVPHRIVFRYKLCGIEHLATVALGGIALVSALVCLALTTGVVLVTRTKRGQASTEPEAAR